MNMPILMRRACTAMITAAAVIVASSGPMAADQDVTLLDALDEDFSTYIASVDADRLRQLPRGDALYLLSQGLDLLALEADYFAEIIAEYTFSSTPSDLLFFAQVAETRSADLTVAYCEKVATQLPGGRLPGDCLNVMAQMFTMQYGRGLPKDAYTPAILDAIYRITEDDALIAPATIGDLSSSRALRSLELSPATSEKDVLAALANGGLCNPASSGIEALADLRAFCQGDAPIDAGEATRRFRALHPILGICSEREDSVSCLVDLTTLHSIGPRCRVPVQRASLDEWYGSRFFRTCMTDYLDRQ